MITLYQPEPCFGLPNVSPYCMKLEGFLRFYGIAFTQREGLPFQGPYKKIPFADLDGQRLGDSTAIIDRLLSKHGIEYDPGLDLPAGLAFQRLAEEHLYWSLVYFRWFDPDVWPRLRAALFAKVPALIRPLVVAGARKAAGRALYGQGMGRLPEAMIIERASADLAALAHRLEGRPFICGDRVTHFDFSIWAVLSQLINCELEIHLTPIARSHPALVDYLERMNLELASRSAPETATPAASLANV